MSQQDLAIVILAAGKGTRMKSDQPKVMHALAGKPMVSLLLEQVQQLNPERIVVVVGPDMPDLEKLVHPHKTAVQHERLGTGDAVKAALPALEDFDGNVMILLGDEPFVPMNVLAEMASHDQPTAMAIIPPDPAGLGRMVMSDDGYLEAIVEEKDCSEAQREIYVCNSGNYCMPSRMLKNWIPKIENNNAQKEYYLTDIVEIAKNEGNMFEAFTIPIDHVWGINDRLQLAEHENVFQEMMRDHFLRQGVSMVDPDSVYFHHDTKLAPGVFLEPNIYFGPDVQVDDNVRIKAFSHIEGAQIKAGATIGPFARLRPGAEIGEDVRVGNFVEIKNSQIGKGAKINHLAYVGDCEMGERSNFSAGAITVNYDGYMKYKTIIGNDVMVGSNVNLVAPVNIGDGSFLAAGSTIHKDVPTDALSIARDEQQVKEGWAERYRSKKEQDA